LFESRPVFSSHIGELNSITKVAEARHDNASGAHLPVIDPETPDRRRSVLDIGDKEPFISRTLVGAPTKGERITEHLLDGQQRLTALWRGLNNNYDDRTFFLFLKKDEETGMPYYAV